MSEFYMGRPKAFTAPLWDEIARSRRNRGDAEGAARAAFAAKTVRDANVFHSPAAVNKARALVLAASDVSS